MMRIRTVLSAAAVSLLILSGCSEEEPVVDGQAEPPAAAQEERTDEAAETTEEGLDKLRDAARIALEGAGELAEGARKAADQALEDAGPALERAGELAGQFKDSVDGIIAQGAEDLERAARALEEQIEEATGEQIDLAPGDPAAVLAPAEELRADTRAAARARPAGVGPDYVGVWAGDAASCARIDQEAVEIFAVITPSTIRRYESVCNIDAAPLIEGEAVLDASCIAEGMEEERQITLAMSSPDALSIQYGDGRGGAELVRCHLPE
jgi:hypothetical protein